MKTIKSETCHSVALVHVSDTCFRQDKVKVQSVTEERHATAGNGNLLLAISLMTHFLSYFYVTKIFGM